jgi:hypothetical protein
MFVLQKSTVRVKGKSQGKKGFCHPYNQQKAHLQNVFRTPTKEGKGDSSMVKLD